MGAILAIDVGTSSMRGLLVGASGETLAMVRITYRSEYLGDGVVEQDPHSWEKALINITTDIVQWAKTNSRSIEAVSLTAQRSSAIPVDRSGTPLHNAIMWQDMRTGPICNALQEHTSAIYSRTGLHTSPVMAAPKFTWFKRERPDVYRRAYKLLVIPDYLMFLMTGEFLTDHTYGSRTLLMNLRTLEWDSDLLELFDLDEEKLCKLVEPGRVVGKTTDAFRSRTGMRSGTPVVSAGGDQQCSALGAGIIASGSIQVTSGTGSFVIAASHQPRLDRQMRFLCSVSAIPGQYVLESSILAASSLYLWIANTFYERAEVESASIDRLGEDAARSPAGANAVIALPYLQGRGTPDWNLSATGSFVNITVATTRGDLVRAALEGIVAEISENLDIIVEHVGAPHTIAIAGGLTSLPLFNQIQADMYGRRVTLPSNKETTSLGAWASAAVAIGIHGSYATAVRAAHSGSTFTTITPIDANIPIYSRLRNEKQKLYRALVTAGLYSRFHDSADTSARSE